ncbi:MAG: hypothetical protein ABIQ10_10075 [Gemmatimonadaceae bacterium]
MSQRLKSALLGFGFAVAALPLAGCASAPAQGGRVYIRQGPPPVRREVIVERPGPDFVYIRGHWGYGGGAYAWVPGRWDRPDGRRRWQEGHWAHDRYGWYWIEGRWR